MKSVYEPLTWMVGGEAGYGISTMGASFARICTRAGLFVHGYGEYPSLIRGGHNTAAVRVSYEPVTSHGDKVDILLALNKETVNEHLHEMAENGAVIYDNEAMPWDTSAVKPTLRLVAVPLARLTKELGADRVMRNTVALGASLAVFGFEFSHIEEIMTRTFLRKGQDVVDYNIKVARAGFDYVHTTYSDGFPTPSGTALPFEKKMHPLENAPKHILMSGNEALAMGALKAGVKFMAAYPMTPVTSIMLTVASWGSKYGIVMKQTEDEIAAMNMAIGASYMGVRTLTATSGGGFALMTEAIGMAAITETPLVAIEGMRPGPSTGLPTWTDQGDLRFVMHSSQGEFPRMVLLPGDITECFEMMLKAYNWAEDYQMVVLLITDKYMGESIHTADPFKHEDYVVNRGERVTMEEALALASGAYKRYEFTERGVSKRSVPGMPNTIHVASTDEHREDGDLDESSENRIKMVDKRSRKLETLQREALVESDGAVLHGPEFADLTMVGWGSMKGPILEAMKIFNAAAEAEGRKERVNFLQIKMALPFPSETVTRILNAAKKTLLVENNATAQMAGLIREYTSIHLQNHYLRYDGRPIHSAEILTRLGQELKA
ncbi:2-oxoacid:acceptor oxidoreductase subunit alpha [Candidatus Peregrinibacteria bacterium]|nr:MAG: 2-oxoacid:acceptor oxidoreductase subunit alpha [Candidatus Peregrinibacteria bacterium]